HGSTALAVMRNIAKSDSSHFSAALWGCYYAKQLGDTVESYEFLKRLRRIDITAPIVGDWEAMRKLEEQMRKTRSARDRASIHREISAIYAKLELYDEALDALERAYAFMPDDVGILVARAQVFETKRALWGAQQTYRRILELEPANEIAREKLRTGAAE
ncbi:MAG: hypothetical protein HY563_05140, partial [Ignavibacteriales bacterium]|nr:hypothetical protein [Ignavibacteriales bacterium]